MKQIYFVLLLCCCSMNVAAQQAVEPMVKAKYAQTTPFNDSCPDGSAAGCGPVAIAQILNCYKQPLHGYGSVAYTCSSSGIEVSKDFSETAFDWDNILDEYTSGAYSAQAKAVSELIFACGAAVYADYGTSTGTNNYAKMIYGMQHYLHFSPECRYLKRKFYSTAEWIEMLNGELRAGHPVFYRGDWRFNGKKVGHMYVVDGIDSDGMYHVNFGHGGSGDKFVDINVINQNGSYPGGRPVCYNASQAMVTNCFPTPDESNYAEQACILDEPLVLNEDNTISKVVVKTDETFSLGCVLRNCAGQSARVYFHWVLEQDGKQIEEYEQGSYGLSAGYKFSEAIQREISIPSGIADGNYQLKLYTKSDLQPGWQEVWANAPTNVDVEVANGMATITIPDSHKGNPCLYLREPIKEVETEYANKEPGISFLLALTNNTINNFEDVIRFEIVADGSTYTYDATIPVYSQSKTDFHVLIPQSSVDLTSKTITSIKTSYLYDGQYIELGMVEPTNISTIAKEKTSDVSIYTLQGTLVRRISASNVSSDYQQVLEELPRGTYVIKEGQKGHKFLKY